MKIRLFRRNTRNCVVMADGEKLGRTPCKDAETFGLNAEKDLNPDELADLVDALLVPTAVNMATQWLATREMSAKQVRENLRKRDFAAEVIDAAIEKLKDYGYLDDLRFAMALVNMRQNDKPYGRLRLIADLRAKGVSKEIAERALQEFDEQKAAMRAMEIGKRRGLEGQKLYNFMYRRGFTSSVISTLLKMEREWNE